LDRLAGRGVDVVADLSDVRLGSLPFEDDCFDEMFGRDILDRVHSPTALMSELYRIARPGCQLVLQLPHGASDLAWSNPDTVRPFFPESFSSFSQPYYWKADQDYTADWQVSFILLKLNKERYLGVPHAERLRDVHEKRNVVLEMTAVLIAMKPSRPRDRNLMAPPRTELLLVED
jgi:SAM-dependent methyltransferase